MVSFYFTKDVGETQNRNTWMCGTAQAQMLAEVFRTTFSGQNRDFKISGSIGVSCYPEDSGSYTGLFQKADQALYYAKSHGKDGYALYSPEMTQEEQARRANDLC